MTATTYPAQPLPRRCKADRKGPVSWTLVPAFLVVPTEFRGFLRHDEDTRLLGYTRVSTYNQDPELQMNLLLSRGTKDGMSFRTSRRVAPRSPWALNTGSRTPIG